MNFKVQKSEFSVSEPLFVYSFKDQMLCVDRKKIAQMLPPDWSYLPMLDAQAKIYPWKT